MKKKALLLINPVSGFGKQKIIEGMIDDNINGNILTVDIAYTEYRGHARILARDAIGKYDVVVAVGGDGTVNEVGSALTDTDTVLAIIPTGSGNGLARHLKIPMKPEKALQVLNNFNEKRIDTMKLNQYTSLNVAGVGFDAHISHLFAGSKQRGLITYIRLIAQEFPGYKALDYKIKIDGEKIDVKAFLISFANSSQYGNNFMIAPNARIDDGIIDICIVNDFPKYAAPAVLLSLIEQDFAKDYYDKIVKAKEIEIEHPHDLQGHIDGEPVVFGKSLSVSIKPLSLKVIVPGGM